MLPNFDWSSLGTLTRLLEVRRAGCYRQPVSDFAETSFRESPANHTWIANCPAFRLTNPLAIIASPTSFKEHMTSRVALPARENGQKKATEDDDEQRLVGLNGSLTVLATIFPRIHPEVFREMLQTFDGESGLHVVAEQLLKHQDEWVKGRWRKAVKETAKSKGDQLPVTAEERFRRASYKWAVRTTLYEEFKALSRCKIEGVLAEENFCYTRARLTLQDVASKSWRNSFNVFLSKWLKSSKSTNEGHHMMIWLKDQEGGGSRSVPVLKETGDAELDAELNQSVLLPFLQKAKREREDKDWEIAMTLNEAEAMDADAMYECQCCFSDTTFEQLATCTTGAHVICFRCIKNAISEALFGQSWGRNIDNTRGQLNCLALMSDESCDGCISHSATRRAILQSKGGKEALSMLETRLAKESLSKARLALVHCPFCAYAEVDELYFPPSTVRYRLNTVHLEATVFLILLMLVFLPLLPLYTLVSRLLLFWELPTITSMFSTSLGRLSRSRHLSARFQCRSPLCALPSCLTCFKTWHDPHVCHESAALSLRTTIEAARTAALKRTCPHCGLGFIKDSGCNKLTCVCGYAMCYICRQGLGHGHRDEGYRHFCQHFRPAGGVCRECDKCDLYINEDDDKLVKRAGAFAEKEWREKEGMTGVVGIGGGQEDARRAIWLDTDWTMQKLIDWWVKKVIDC